MATVSHYAMHPYPALYGDGNTQLTSNQYYVASNQQLSPMYDKAKKTWSQRLKITKSEKASSPLSELPDYSQSALSRSMKYAEPWIYGTVRGIPALPLHGQAIFTPIPTEVAVVVCSCPEYLNGTKKEIKKASVCKKCKGSRLPFTPIGGTVRLRPTSAPIIHTPRASAGTVRLPSSSSGKSRPTILDPRNDPYDLMRRSRLVSPEPKQASIDKTLKHRAKSASPTRGRSRNRGIRQEDLVLTSNSGTHINGNGSVRHLNTMRMKPERWLESIDHDPGGRKSILQCDVNPYDLISNKSQTINEFSPEPDMFLPSIKKNSAPINSTNANRSKMKAIAGQRISLGDTSTKSLVDSQLDRELKNTSQIPRRTNSYGKQESKLSDYRVKLESSSQQADAVKPKRPPRRKQETSSADEDISELAERASKISDVQERSMTLSIPKTSSSLQIKFHDTASAANSPSGRQGIKSILKRPSSTTPSSSDIDAKNNESNRLEKTNSTTPNIENGDSNFSSGTSHTFHFNEKDSRSGDRTIGGGSQFYLPMPQTRKKVQFMVENRIIHHDPESDHTIVTTAKTTNIPNGNKEEDCSAGTLQKRKEVRIQNFVTNDEHTSNDAYDERNESMKEQRKNFDSLHRPPDQNRTESRFAEIESKNSPYNDSYIKDKSDKSTMSTKKTTTIRNSMNSDENSLIVVNAAEKNGIRFPSSELDSNRRMFSERIVKEEEDDNGIDGVHQVKDTFKSDSTSSITPVDSGSNTRRNKFLRRTHSARSNNTTTVLLNFNDTMALRIKNIRPDSRDIFTEGSGCQSLSPSSSQPRLPTLESLGTYSQPPLSATTQKEKDSTLSSRASLPLSTVVFSSQHSSVNSKERLSPEASNVSTSEDSEMHSKDGMQRHKSVKDPVVKDTTTVVVPDFVTEELPPRPPRQGYKKISWQQQENETNAIVKSEQQDYPLENNGSTTNSNERASVANKENKVNGNTIIFKEQSENKNVQAWNSSLISTEASQKHVFHGKMTENEKLLQARNEILNGSRLFGSTSDKGIQKTIVRVTPCEKEETEVHRLKICHEENCTPFNVSQKKTSILINGDNCYSTVNVGNDTPLYQSSVVVNNGVSTISTDTLRTSLNTVTINVSSPSTLEDEFIFKNNKINSLLNGNLLSNDSSKSTMDPSSSSSCTGSDGDSSSYSGSLKRGSTLITLDFNNDQPPLNRHTNESKPLMHEEELVQILRNPVEAVKRNLIPHVCGKSDVSPEKSSSESNPTLSLSRSDLATITKQQNNNSFITKLLEDPMLHQLAEGLESDVVIKLIENSLKRLKDSRQSLDTSGTKDNENMNKLIDLALQKVKEERIKLENKKQIDVTTEESQNYLQEQHENGSISSNNSYGSANYDLFDFDNNESDCYQSCSSEMTTEEDAQSTRSKFYQMLVDATLSEIEISTSNDDDHHYESIRVNCDPIYEEINDRPPPLPLSPPPIDIELDKKGARSMFEGASKYDILSYLVDAKERGIVREEPYEYNFTSNSEIIVEEEIDTLAELNKSKLNDVSSRISHLSVTSDSSEDISLTSSISEKITQRRPTSEIERNDSGVGSETSKSSRSKYQNPTTSSVVSKNSPIHLCEDCDSPVETQITGSGVMYAPLVCRKCSKKRAERKEIIIEIVETEEKYGRDLQIILEEFFKPMLVAGLLTQEQLSAIFLNTEELLENSQALAEKMRDALDIALEQGDDDFLTVNIGRILLEATPMLHAFETYCIRQGAASLLLANMEKDKELLRIFLRVSQMENAVLRRMNLNSFLMVPVQRVTKYPLLLARLHKVTPTHFVSRPFLKQAQEKIELHLNHMNQEAKDVPTKLWRRISSSSPNRRSSNEIDLINIKLRKMAVDVLEWNHDEVRFAMEGKLLYTQPTDSNWKKARTIKLTHINALLVTNGKPSGNYTPEKAMTDQLSFPKHAGIREASLLMVKEKCGRYTLIREPLYLDRCIICTEADWDEYFEVHEILSKDTFIFKAEDGTRTKQWYTQLQYHSQGMGAWRKRRNALANIMINGMLTRN